MTEFGVFAKYWQPGQVKTRLAAAIGADSASAVYRTSLETLLRRFNSMAERRVLAYTPATRYAEFVGLAGDTWQLRPQAAGDLGVRLRGYFEDAFAGGADAAVLIGSDSPTLPVHYVSQAFASLQKQAVVLGPATDGGYYLIGARGSVPPVFSGVTWSSPDVWRQTVQLLEEAGCPFAVLPEWYDVDEVESLRRLREELEVGDLREPAFRDLRGVVERVWAASGGLDRQS